MNIAGDEVTRDLDRNGHIHRPPVERVKVSDEDAQLALTELILSATPLNWSPMIGR